MPNKITITGQAGNTQKSIEYLHPNTNVWQSSNILTSVTPGTYTNLKARLKGSNPEIAFTYTGVVTVLGVVNAPTISSFTPTSGLAGSSITISGTYFTGATLVSINSGSVGSFTVDSPTQITAVLNSSQTSGKVRVTTPDGTAVSSSDFTVTTPIPVAPVAPTNVAVDDTANTFSADIVSGYATANDYEFSLDGGSNYVNGSSGASIVNGRVVL